MSIVHGCKETTSKVAYVWDSEEMITNLTQL